MAPHDIRIGKRLFAIGRSGLALLFIAGGVAKAVKPAPYLQMMADANLVPAIPLLVIVALLELLAGAALIMGHRLQAMAALILCAHTLLINAFIHRFWEHQEPIRSLTIGLFTKNVAIAAALLLFAGASILIGRDGKTR